MARTERFRVELEAQDNASPAVDALSGKLDALEDRTATVELDADDEATEAIEQVDEATTDLDGTTAEIELDAQDEATEVVEDVAEATEDLDGTEAEVSLVADDDASPTIEDAQDAVDDFAGTATATLDAVDVTGEVIDAATEAVEEFDDTTGTAILDADDEATDIAEEATEAVEALDDVDGTGRLDADDEATDAAEEATEAVEALDDVTGTPVIDADDQATGDIDAVSEALETLDDESAAPSIEVEGDDASVVEDVTEALSDLDAAPEATASLDVEGDEEAAGSIGSIMDDLGTLGAGVVTGAAASALSSVFSDAAQHVLDVKTLADLTGTSLETATGLEEQWSFVGGSVQQLLTALGRVNDKMAESPEIAADLGIEISANQTPLETFVAVVDALNSDQLTANERLSLAVEIFGRRGAATVLKIGTEIGNLSTAIGDIPEWQVVTEADVAAALEYKQTMDELGDLIAEAGQAFVTKWAGPLRQLFDLAETTGRAIGDMRVPEVTGLGDWLDALDPERFDEITANFADLGGNIETLLFNVEQLHRADIEAALGAGIPPEVLASAKMTAEAVELLVDEMADVPSTADAMKRALDDNKVSQEEWAAATADGVITLDEVEAAISDTTGTLDTQQGSLVKTRDATREYASAMEIAQAESDALAEQIKAHIDVLEESAEAHRDQAQAITDSADGFLNEREAARDAADALDDYRETLEDTEATTRDQERALDDMVGSYDAAADAVVESTRLTRQAEGATLSEVEALDIKNSSLLESTRIMNEDEAAAIFNHVARINGIPTSKVTEILTDDDPNNIAQMEALLANTSRTRKALMLADVDDQSAANANAALDKLAKDRTTKVFVQTVRTDKGRQRGDPFTPHDEVLLVGEAGPELVALPGGSRIHTAEQTDEMLRNFGAGTTVNNYNNTVHMPPGTPTSTLRNLRRYQRRNGHAVTA
jgi:hypothetical protein